MEILFCAAKGGVGKTTCSLLISNALLESGHEVSIHDFDPQHTVSRVVKDLDLNIDLNSSSSKNIIIDTAPDIDNPNLKKAVHSADAIILVTKPSPADIYTIKDTANFIKKEGKGDKTRILFNQVKTGTTLSNLEQLKLMADRIGLPMLKNKIHEREVYKHYFLLGWSCLGKTDKEEILKAALEIVLNN